VLAFRQLNGITSELDFTNLFDGNFYSQHFIIFPEYLSMKNPGSTDATWHLSLGKSSVWPINARRCIAFNFVNHPWPQYIFF
jgi:hypothetical protein